MIDPNNFDDLCAAIRRHPDYRGSVIWERADIELAAKEYGVSADELDNMVDLDIWQDMACWDGWDYAIYRAASALQQENESND